MCGRERATVSVWQRESDSNCVAESDNNTWQRLVSVLKYESDRYPNPVRYDSSSALNPSSPTIPLRGGGRCIRKAAKRPHLFTASWLLGCIVIFAARQHSACRQRAILGLTPKFALSFPIPCGVNITDNMRK